jgi:hypothetical protein
VLVGGMGPCRDYTAPGLIHRVSDFKFEQTIEDNTDSAGARLTWLGPANPLTEQLSLPEPGRRSKFDRAREFLLTILGNGPLSAEKIWQEAQGLDLSVRTVNAAKSALGIASKRLVAEGRVCSLWMLAGDVAEEPAGELIAEFGERFEGDPLRGRMRRRGRESPEGNAMLVIDK